MYYIGIVDGKDDVRGLRIPDCPGAYGGGPTAEAAIADGTSALAAYRAHGAGQCELRCRFLAVIDAEAARRGVTRAAFLASAAREKIIQAR